MWTLGRRLLLGLLLVGILAGCATTGTMQEQVGLPNEQNPEYLAHPYRLLALPLYFGGNLAQYIVIEPLYFALNRVPNAVGLSLQEQQYLNQREEAWAKTFSGREPR